MLVFISIIMLHFGCGAAIMTLMFKGNPIKQDFNIFEILICILFGPILILTYVFCWIYLWIYERVNKRKEQKNERTS